MGNIPLGADPYTAYRLALVDGEVLVNNIMSAWNAIDTSFPKKSVDMLPEEFSRDGNKIISEKVFTPIELTLDEILYESMRLTELRYNADEHGYYDISKIVRIAHGIGAKRLLKKTPGIAKFTEVIRENIMLESRMRGDTFMIRRRLGPQEPRLDPVQTEVTCPGDESPRPMKEKASFGEAFRTILNMPRDLLADTTFVRFFRDNEERTAIFKADRMAWETPQGSDLGWRDPSDPIMFSYKNGQYVYNHIGFVSVSHTGKVFANIGLPIDDCGEDAFIRVIEKLRVDSKEEAFGKLAARTDVEHVFQKVQTYDDMMGFWLSTMGE